MRIQKPGSILSAFTGYPSCPDRQATLERTINQPVPIVAGEKENDRTSVTRADVGGVLRALAGRCGMLLLLFTTTAHGERLVLTNSVWLSDLELVSTVRESIPPRVLGVSPPPGKIIQLTNITVTFTEPVTGVMAYDLWINGVPATRVTGSGTTYTFGFLQPPYGDVEVSWNLNNQITDLAATPNPFNPTEPDVVWQYYLIDPDAPVVAELQPPAGLTVRRLSEIEVWFNEPVRGVEASDLLINGQPAANVVGLSAGPYRFQFPPPANGRVRLAWISNSDIADLAEPPNAFVGGQWEYFLDPQVPAGDLVINEFLAENISGLKDETGETEDWIELFNRGDTPVNLHGWSLTDDPAEPGKWSFPDIMLPAKQYLVVFASGKDLKPTGPGAKLHTNFKLNPNGEYLALYSPDAPRQEVSALAPQFPEQRNDYSYGLDATGQWRYFRTPTPGKSNGSSLITDTVAPVHFSVQRGFFNTPFGLSLATETLGATIRYTLDGSEPLENKGYVFGTPFTVSSTRTVRAAAFQTNGLPSRTVTHTYLYNLPASRQLLPALSLVTATNNLFGTNGIMEINPRNTTKHGIAWERPISAELIRTQDNGGFHVDCGLRVQGGSYVRARYDPAGALPYSKYSFRLYFRSAYGPGRLEYPWFGDLPVPSFDCVSLRAGMNDHSNPYIRDELARRLFGDTGQVTSHGTFVNLFLNGVYKGYYNPAERIDADFLQSWHGGGPNWDLLAQSGEVREGDATAWNALRNYVNTKDPSVVTNYQEIERQFDLVNFVDYLLCNMYGATGDWPQNNWRAARERVPGGKFRYYVWDAEWSYGYRNPVTWNTISNELAGTTEVARFYTRLKVSPEFRLLFADRAHKHLDNDGALTDARIRTRYNELKGVMAGTISGFDDSIGTSWIPSRRAYMLKYLAAANLLQSSNAPVFNQFGGRVPRDFVLTMTATNGTIYYTTNGADPRVRFSNTLSPEAIAVANKGSIALHQTVAIKARMLAGTNWSALTEAVFQVAEFGMPLRITEIMPAPLGGDAFEFIELQNTSTAPLDLSGVSLEGLDFYFPAGTPSLPAGGRLVLIPDFDPAAFAQRYPGVAVAGIYQGRLADAGERLAIRNGTGLVVSSLRYGAHGGWPEANATGRSWEIVDPEGDPNDPANWQSSPQPGGTPGAPNTPRTLPRVRLNEIMAQNVAAVTHEGNYPDWIELYNPQTGALDLGGWSLTDSDASHRFVFPPGTTLSAGDFLVVWCDRLTNSSGFHADFALNRQGETIFLHDDQSRQEDAVSFGLQVADFSVGRLESDGAWQLTTPTPGAANEAAPLASVTNLTINEFMANPLPGEADWIELYNKSTNDPVSLRGVSLGTSNAVFLLHSLSFVAPRGYARLWADETAGPEHVDLKLPASGGTVFLVDETGLELNRINYGLQREGVSLGRLPDGAASLTNFANSTSPGAWNYWPAYSGPFINELMARNETAVKDSSGRIADWIELFNPAPTAFSLAGMSLSVGKPEPFQWTFPPGAQINPLSYLLVWCDASRSASPSGEMELNLGRNLPGEGGGVYLFSPAGQLADLVEYGFQLPDVSIGRTGNRWALLAQATPARSNAATAVLGSATGLRLNEWMAASSTGYDWFELYNPGPQPVSLSSLYLTDDPSLAGRNKFVIGPLSFIAGNGWVTWKADGHSSDGPDHVNFNLDGLGETLRLYQTNYTVIDSVDFMAQAPDVSEGRFPDGSAMRVRFPLMPSPGAENHLAPPDARNNAPLVLQFIGCQPDGAVLLQMGGSTNAVFVLQVSTNLLEWNSIATFLAPDGQVQYRDYFPGYSNALYFRGLQYQ